MGEFDFGQFQQIFEYLSNKLKEGGALTPEEQQTYDMLIKFSNEGLNLTNTADFKSLYDAFNGLADEATKKEFEKLYGTNFTQDENGKIAFTRPGTVIEQFMRRGQSVNDGPAMAALSEGLQGYLKQIAQNKFAAMTNSYAAMTPIRAQNIQAATNAGQIASTAIGRRAAVAPSAIGGGRLAPESAGDVGGEGVNIDTRGGPAGTNQPGFFDKYGAALIGLLGSGALGIGGYLLKDWWNKKPTTPGGNTLGGGSGDLNPYTGKPVTSPYEMSMQNPDAAMSMYNPQMNNPYGNTGNLGPDYYNTPSGSPNGTGFNGPVDQYWNQPDQQYSFSNYNVPQQTPAYDPWASSWNAPDQTVYPDVGGNWWDNIYSGGGGSGGDPYSGPVDYSSYYDSGGGMDSYYPTNDNYGSGWY